MTSSKRIEAALDAVLAEVEQELRTMPERRTADTYERLAELHAREAECWNAYVEFARGRLVWLAATAAADRARQLANHYAARAAALLQDAGALWPSEFVRREVA